MNFKGIKLLFVLGAVASVAAFAAACGGGDDEPEAQPTTAAVATATTVPAATAVPTKAPVVPVANDPEGDPKGFLASLPDSEVSCAEKAAGGTAELEAIVAGTKDAEAAVSLAIAKCFSQSTMVSVIVGQIERDSGPLSDDTKKCIAEKSGGVAFDGMFSAQPDAAAIVGLMQSAFCLNDAERMAAESGGVDSMFGGTDGPGIDAMECFVNGIGPDKMADALGMLTGQGGALTPEFLNSAVTCGLMTDEDIADSGMTTEQMSCMFTEAGDLFQSFVSASSTGQPPDLSQLSGLIGAFEKCGVDYEALGDDETVPPLGTVEPGTGTSSNMTDEQGLCLFASVNQTDVIAAMMPGPDGNPDMTKLAPVIEALTKCGIDAEAFLELEPAS